MKFDIAINFDIASLKLSAWTAIEKGFIKIGINRVCIILIPYN